MGEGPRSYHCARLVRPHGAVHGQRHALPLAVRDGLLLWSLQPQGPGEVGARPVPRSVRRLQGLRATFSPEDSANLKAERLACLDYYAHVLNEYSDKELVETLKVASGDAVGSSDAID